LGVKYRGVERVESIERKSEGNGDAYMKEPEHITDSTIDPRKKQKKRKGGTSVNNSKQRKRE
jgi:hypothetical protein